MVLFQAAHEDFGRLHICCRDRDAEFDDVVTCETMFSVVPTDTAARSEAADADGADVSAREQETTGQLRKVLVELTGAHAGLNPRCQIVLIDPDVGELA